MSGGLTVSAADPPDRPGPVTIDEIFHALPVLPYATTRMREWGGVTVDLYRPVPGTSGSYAAFDHHSLYYIPNGSGRLLQGRDGVVHESIVSAGMSLIMPAGYDSTWEGDVPASARMRVPTSLVDAAAEQIGRRSAAQVEVRNMFEMRDPAIERMALLLMVQLDLRPHPTQRLILESISCALAAHLLRSYNAFEPVEQIDAHAFSKAELGRLTTFIHDNIDRSISLADLAAIVNVSRFHFARLFKRSTGVTAIAYVEQCRIQRAQSLIADSDMPLAEIALTTGFADQSHFTRRFHRHVGCTPAAFARDQGRRRSVRPGSG